MTSKPVIKTSEVLAIVLVVGVLVVILYPAVMAALADGTPGEMIPTVPPNESDRVYHPNGLSIIKPPNWKVSITDAKEDSLLSISPQGVGRAKSMISIRSIEAAALDEMVFDDFQKSKFNGFSSYERMQLIKAGTLDDPPVSEYELFVYQNENRWFIRFTIQRKIAALPDEIREYIDTISFPEEKR